MTDLVALQSANDAGQKFAKITSRPTPQSFAAAAASSAVAPFAIFPAVTARLML